MPTSLLRERRPRVKALLRWARRSNARPGRLILDIILPSNSPSQARRRAASTPHWCDRMRSGSWFLSATLATGFGLPALPSPLLAQEPNPTPHAAVSEVPPDAPQPQFTVASLSLPSEQAQCRTAVHAGFGSSPARHRTGKLQLGGLRPGRTPASKTGRSNRSKSRKSRGYWEFCPRLTCLTVATPSL